MKISRILEIAYQIKELEDSREVLVKELQDALGVQASEPQQAEITPEDRVLLCFADGKSLRLPQIRRKMRRYYKNVSPVLTRLIKEGKLERIDRGTYRSVRRESEHHGDAPQGTVQ